jgi:hypothetical protein
MRRLSLFVLPFLAAFALVFGLFYLYTAFQLVQQGYAIRAVLFALFGVVGVGLATGIWVARKRLASLRAANGPDAGGPGAGAPHAARKDPPA